MLGERVGSGERPGSRCPSQERSLQHSELLGTVSVRAREPAQPERRSGQPPRGAWGASNLQHWRICPQCAAPSP